jgi:agmatinase
MSYTSPYVGIATFLKSRYVAEPTGADGHVAVLGIPFDEATTSRPGARYGPRALRDVSTFYGYREEGEWLYDGEADARLLDGVRVVDAGDVYVPVTAPPEMRHERIAGRVQALVAAGLFPVVLGGDHSITYPVLQGLVAGRSGRPVHLVQFDTHMDYWDEEEGMRYTHASPIIRAHEDSLLTGVTQYGIRGLHQEADNIELARERGVHTFRCRQAKQTPVEELVAHIEPGADAYVTFDIDALDPVIAPGTGTPEPGGFTYYEAKDILRAVASRAHLVGMDMVEVSPLFDPAQTTALHGVRLIIDCLGAAFATR